MEFRCWKCGAGVRDEPMPLGRESRCRACESDLHVCRQCRFFDPTKGKSCAEPVADEVRDKERSNFCGYFAINADAHVSGDAAEAARRELESMFGVDGDAQSGAGGPDASGLEARRRQEAEEAREKLSKLFGLDDD